MTSSSSQDLPANAEAELRAVPDTLQVSVTENAGGLVHCRMNQLPHTHYPSLNKAAVLLQTPQPVPVCTTSLFNNLLRVPLPSDFFPSVSKSHAGCDSADPRKSNLSSLPPRITMSFKLPKKLQEKKCAGPRAEPSLQDVPGKHGQLPALCWELVLLKRVLAQRQ